MRHQGKQLRRLIGIGLVLSALGAGPRSGLADDIEPPPMPLGAPATPTSPPSAPMDPAFLSLPAHDIERGDAAKGDGKLKVGDTVTLSLPGLGQDLKLEVAPGSESLTDQGWEINVEPGVAGGAPDEFRFRATPLKAGKLTLPSLAIRKKDADAAEKSLARTNPFTIEVESAIKADDPKPEQPADLRPPVSLRFPWWVLVLGGLLLAALMGGGIYAYRRHRARKRKPKSSAPIEPPKPEDEIALAMLAELERNGPLRRGEFKAHYFRLSELFKAYLGARYRFEASESTSRELISRLEEKRALDDRQIDQLESLFDQLDLVKFTDQVPIPDEGLQLLGIVRSFVLATRRTPEAANEVAKLGPEGGGR